MQEGMTMLKFARAAVVTGLLFAPVLSATGAGAIEIERVVSDKGIEAWLVEEHSIPVVAMSFVVLLHFGLWHDISNRQLEFSNIDGSVAEMFTSAAANAATFYARHMVAVVLHPQLLSIF